MVNIHVDDCLLTGTQLFKDKVVGKLREDFKVGSEDTNDVMFTGQRIKWAFEGEDEGKPFQAKNKKKHHITVDQELKVEELGEIVFDKHLREDQACTPDLHRQYRSVLGQINWLQSRTQFQSCYDFSRCASAAAAPNIGHVKLSLIHISEPTRPY